MASKPRTHGKRSERSMSTAGRRVSAAVRCGVFVVDPERVRRGREAVLGESVVGDIAGTFKVLAHPTRVRIIQALADSELCVCEISEVLGLSVSATSHQLQLLRHLRLVRARSEGKLVYYALSNSFLVALLHDCTCHVQGKDWPR
jgi:DNA-binding transcriptional ArsR family regulator